MLDALVRHLVQEIGAQGTIGPSLPHPALARQQAAADLPSSPSPQASTRAGSRASRRTTLTSRRRRSCTPRRRRRPAGGRPASSPRSSTSRTSATCSASCSSTTTFSSSRPSRPTTAAATESSSSRRRSRPGTPSAASGTPRSACPRSSSSTASGCRSSSARTPRASSLPASAARCVSSRRCCEPESAAAELTTRDASRPPPAQYLTMSDLTLSILSTISSRGSVGISSVQISKLYSIPPKDVFYHTKKLVQEQLVCVPAPSRPPRAWLNAARLTHLRTSCSLQRQAQHHRGRRAHDAVHPPALSLAQRDLPHDPGGPVDGA